MAASSIKIKVEWDKFQKKMNDRAAALEAHTRTGLQEALDWIHGALPGYPPQSNKPFPWKSDKQRIYVILAIKAGKIKVPYRRTGKLQQKITTEVRTLGSSIVGVIGTSVPYAPWVISNKSAIGAGPQAAYHKGNWWILQDEVQKHRGKIREILQKSVRQAFK